MIAFNRILRYAKRTRVMFKMRILSVILISLIIYKIYINERMKTTIKLTKRDPPRRRHNVPLAESILLSLTIFLSFGLFLMMTINLVRDYLSTLRFMDSLDDDSWEHVHYHGEIQVTQKNENLPYRTFRYKYKTHLPFDALFDILNDPDQSTEWFAWTVMGKDVPEENKRLDQYHVEMKIPYLHRHNREFLLHHSSDLETMAQDHDKGQIKQATFQYKTKRNDPTPLICKQCKKGELDMTITLITLDDGQNTDIEMRSYMNLHSNRIPTFLMNNVSMQWGTISILKLGKMCRSKLGLSDVVDTKMSFYNLFPIKR
jgi:hypothetical protein